ncbi:hypothetical protein [Vagococcus sp. WN89Y]|uniref:hypothetical protein n=1 Tax=Vagococcus sp. WN89Y TaxID=3457258 RepID=UPI003FCC743F
MSKFHAGICLLFILGSTPTQQVPSEGQSLTTCKTEPEHAHKHSLKHLVRHNFHRLIRFLDAQLLTQRKFHVPKPCRATQSLHSLYSRQKQPQRNKPQALQHYAARINTGEILLMRHKHISGNERNIPALESLRRVAAATSPNGENSTAKPG